MTVGQRIAQKRKELGLSQEGLGERLGVSRQTVYKWESDAALPEIEKLVKLGREFGVSIDWLLGQEDETREPKELTAEQLRMVEEIVGRYLAANPAPEEAPPEGEAPVEPEPPKKRRKWPWVLGGAAVIAVALMFSNLFTRIDRLYQDNQNLQMSLANIRSDVNSEIYGITKRVEDILQSQNTLTAEQSAGVSATDYRANTITVSARVVPRTYVEGMTAEFLLVSNGETVTVPGELGENHDFTAQITGELSDNVTVSVVFIMGDQRETQLLEQFTYLYSDSFPNVSVENGAMWGFGSEIDEYSFVRVDEGNAVRIASLRLGLFRDQKLLAWYEHLDEQPKNYTGTWENTEFFRLDGTWNMEPNHAYCLAAVIVDEYGRERVCSGFPVIYDQEKDSTDYYAPDGVVVTDPDPAHWEY